MKRSFAFILCLLLTLCACGKAPEERPPEENPSVESETPWEGILSDAGQAATLQEYYDRTAIIGRNEWMDGSFIQTESWALEYAALEYPGGTVTAAYNSGYVLPDAMTRDDLSGGVALWDLTIQRADQPTVWETVQVFYFTETADGTLRQCFSGLLAGEDMLATRPEAYAYLALDTRFASRIQTLPDVEIPDGVQALELNFFEEAHAPQDCQVWMLNESVAVILSRYREGELAALAQGDYLLTAYDLDTGETYWHLRDLEDIWNFDSLQNGVLTLRQYAYEGEGGILQVWMEQNQPQWGEFDAQDGGEHYAVGRYALTWQDGSILLDEEVLLAGSTEEDLENEQEMTLYNFHQALDDHRFLFSKAGWEWIEYYGVYDLETRTAHALVSDRQAGEFLVLQVSADGSKALAGHGAYGHWGLTLVDLNTLEQQHIPTEYDSEETTAEQVIANADLSCVAVLDETANGLYQIRVYDAATGAERFTWEVSASLLAGQPTLQLVEEDTLVVSFRQWKTDTEWLYRCRY